VTEAAPSTIKVLLVEDDARLAQLTQRYLESHHVLVTVASDGVEGQAEALRRQYDCVVLDLMLPGRDGIEVCRQLRQRTDVPILMVTARGEESDRVLGLEVGADDYVTKPFSVRELIGRVRAQLRRRDLDRTSTVTEAKTIEAGQVRIDLARHLVSIRGEPANLTRSEFQVLRLLAERPGQVFSRREIMEELWQSEFSGDVRACDVHISNLRQKVERDPQDPELVLTVRGVGYKLAEG
jgi:DNA-binding response OmpR family regulator